MTTEHAPDAPSPGRRSKRWSRRALRAVAWVTGGAAFVAPWAALAAQPKPVVATAPPRQQVIIHKIIRHIYGQAPATGQPSVKYVYAPAPAGPPSTKTGGSHPR